MESRSKQVAIGILLILTLLLAGVSIYVALNLRGTSDTPVATVRCDYISTLTAPQRDACNTVNCPAKQATNILCYGEVPFEGQNIKCCNLVNVETPTQNCNAGEICSSASTCPAGTQATGSSCSTSSVPSGKCCKPITTTTTCKEDPSKCTANEYCDTTTDSSQPSPMCRPKVSGGGTCTPEGDSECTGGICCSCQKDSSTGPGTCLPTGQTSCAAYCGTTPPPTDGGEPTGYACPNDASKQATWCAVFSCPNGDTNGDGKCEFDDTGVVQNNYPIADSRCQGQSSCGQVDWYVGTIGTNYEGNYCGYKFLNLSNCGGGDTGTDTPKIKIKKVIAGGQTVYKVGDTIPFNITITNNGETTFEAVRFRDKFDSEFLQFLSGVATYKELKGNITTADLNDNSNINVDNILDRLNKNNLRPGQAINITLNFKALKETDGLTNNNAIVNADTVKDEDDVDVEVIGEDDSLCGETCATRSECPMNHTCSAGVCKLDACISNPASCSTNGCKVLPVGDPDLPATGILDDPRGTMILIAMLLIVSGIMIYKVDVVALAAGTVITLGNINKKKALAIEEKPKKGDDKKRKDFEDRFNV